MQSAVSFDRCRNEIFHVAFVAHIGLDENSVTSLPFDRLYGLNSCRVVVADNNLRAMSRKEQRCGPAYSTAPSFR